MKKIAFFWRKGLWTFVNVLFIGVCIAAALYIYLQSQLPAVDTLKTIQLQVPLRIYTHDGLLIEEYGEKKRIPLTYDHIPKKLVYALLATEDQRFFEHSGVDILGLARAAVRMIQTGTKSQGGSTITMQVARNFFLTRKKTFLRKFNEILLAIKIDNELSKEKILELYLNMVYLGNRAYGVGAAAEVYYGKPIQDLDIAELAMLAGLPQAPSAQNPVANPVAAKKRRDHVLERMLEGHYITNAEYQHAIQEPVTQRLHNTQITVHAPYVAEMVRQSLYEQYGEETYTNGYKVYTTIDSKLQKTANTALESQLIAYDKRHGYRGAVGHIDFTQQNTSIKRLQSLKAHPVVQDFIPAYIDSMQGKYIRVVLVNGNTTDLALENSGWSPGSIRSKLKIGDVIYVTHHGSHTTIAQIPEAEAALVALNPQTGNVVALVGGFNFIKSKFNRVTQSARQPGSSFKPFIYAAGLMKDFTLATLINNGPIVVDDPSQPTVWRPHNDKHNFGGLIRLKEALVRSQNMVSIRILEDLGLDYTINFLTRFGFQKSALPRGLSLALGTLSVSPMDLTIAYAVFANGGYKIEPSLIDRITDNAGHVIVQTRPMRFCDDCTTTSSGNAPTAKRVISEDLAFLMFTALRDVIQQGTGSAARVLNRDDIAGKTGTTNDKYDAWFAGFQKNLVVTTWVGFDQPKSLREYGAQVALPMWIDFMRVALQKLPSAAPTQPANIVAVRIDPQSGLLAHENQTNAITEYFTEQSIPGNDTSPGETLDGPTSHDLVTDHALQDNLF